MFCSDSPDLILSNICSIADPTEKSRNTVGLWCTGGVAKTKNITRKCSRAYSWFIHRPSSKFYLVDIFKNPHKIKQNPKFHSPNHLSYPISSKPTKIKHFSHFQTQKSNFNLTKIYPQIQNLPYLYALLPITFFHLKIAKIISHHTPYTGGTQKLNAKPLQ